MLLCVAHHKTFDRHHWTFNPANCEILIRSGADSDPTLISSVLDFSHRPAALQPTEATWTSYNAFVFSDKGEGLAAALRKKKGKSGAVDLAGGGAGAE